MNVSIDSDSILSSKEDFIMDLIYDVILF